MTREYDPCRHVIHPETGELIPIPDSVIEYWQAIGVVAHLRERYTRPLALSERLLVLSGIGMAVLCVALAVLFLTAPVHISNSVYVVFLVSTAICIGTDVWRVWRRF